MRHLHRLRLAAAVLILASCGEPSAPRRPASIVVISGTGQNAAVATALPQPIVVEVRDASDRPIRGVGVTWTVTQGGGSLSSTSSSTDASGRTQVQWTLGTTAGLQRITAAVNGVSPAAITAAGAAGAPVAIAVLAGSGQTGTAGTQLPLPLVARVTDAYGNGVGGVSVTFAAAAGTVDPAATATSGSGHAVAAWTLGPEIGAQTAAATLTGTATNVQFTATAVAPPVLVDIDNDVPLTGLDAADKVDRAYRIIVPENATRLRVTTSDGTGDADLYVRYGEMATLQQHDCDSTSPTTTETCDIPNPAPGEWYILVHAWSAYTGVTVRAAYTIGGSLAVSVAGVPAGTSAAVAVTGPAGFSRTVLATETLGGLAAGSYTIFAPNFEHTGIVYNATPSTQEVSVAAGATVNASVTYAQHAGGLNFDITRVHVTQSVQRADGSVPLVAGRTALLRAYARANTSNSNLVPVRVRVYHGGTLVDTRVINTTGSVPIFNDDGDLSTTWNVVLPGALVQPGMSLLVDVDPDNAVAESDEADNSYPANGTPLAPTVRTAPVLQARFVPVVQPDGLPVDVSAGNVHSYINKANALFPVPSIDADVRAPYSFSKALPVQYDSIWGRLLGEILALRTADASTRYYYGVIRPTYTSGGAGLGYIGHPAAVGVEWSNWRAETVAHEWGHNFGRLHVACGNPSNPDPNYPYTGRAGETGHDGWDVRTGELMSRHSYQDLMSYCQPTWISDYTYEAVLDFRGSEAGAAEPSVLVWGRVGRDGVILEPSFEMNAVPSLPEKGGAWRLTGYDAGGAQVLSLSFDGGVIDHLPDTRHFAFAIPLRMLRGRALAELRVSGPSGTTARRQVEGAVAGADISIVREDANTVRVRWNATRSPAVLVRDAATGSVLAIARDGDARVFTGASELEVNMSHGTGSGVRRVTVER